jgi:dephospho-CoA kinase
MAGNPTRTPRVLGLTGAIGCGKTTVGDILLRLGALGRIDADTVVHELMAPGTPVTAAIADSFGTDVLRDDGGVDRAALAATVFADQAALQQLEAITHPAVRTTIRKRLEGLRGRDGIVIVDAVKLLQGDLLPLCDAIWVVTCPPDEQTRRLVEMRRMTTEAAEARIRAQPSFEHPRVTRLIENTGSLDHLRQQVAAAWHELNPQ